MAKPKPATSPNIPSDEIIRLHRAGFSLLPLGGGDDGKRPLSGFAGRGKLPLDQVLGRMRGKGSACYGVRLAGLVVVDCDVDAPDLIAELEDRFGSSPVHVRTPRGLHLYYRATAGALPNLRAEGLPVDIKSGENAYVMGPRSVRPDGGEYRASQGILGIDHLPQIRTAPARQVQPDKGLVPEGGRNRALYRAAIGMVASVDSVDELFGNLGFIRDEECENPSTVRDSELRAIAKWAWRKRLEGKIYQGRNSSVPICRTAIDRLKEHADCSDALALFVTLQDLHGHIPGRTFALKHDAMKAARHTDLSRRRFRAAIETLVDAGLLAIAKNHSAGRFSRKYRLTRARPEMPNVQGLFGQ